MKLIFTDFLCQHWQRVRGGIYRIMKVTAGQVLLITLTMTVSLAMETSGQDVLNRKVSVQIDSKALKDALNTLEDAAKIKFVYSGSSLELSEQVTINASDEKLGEVLNRLFGPLSIQYVVKNKEHIVLKRATEPDVNTQENISIEDKSYVYTIMGKVTSKDGAPMPGVNVLVRGTTVGTSTDAEGRYTIDANGGDVLVFSFIGFKTVEATVSNQTVVDITLEEDIATLSEVIVNAGYWTVKDKEQTGNIARVTADDIGKQPVSNPLNALQGRMAGVYISQDSGIPGSQVYIQIRGQNSLRPNANDPLYIVDGVPFTSSTLSSKYLFSPLLTGTNPLSNINPADIESIEVLKDGDATAIYGTRGSNGVVLITTKKGRAGRTKLDVNFYQGVGKITRPLEVLNTNQYLKMRNEAFKNDGVLPTDVPWDAVDLLEWDTTRYTDWKKELIGGTSHITNVQVSISGGDKNTQFLFGGNFNRETSVFPGDFEWKRGSGYAQLSHTSPNQKFRSIISATFSGVNNDLPFQDFTDQALKLPPNTPPIYDEYGEFDFLWANPYPELKKKYNSGSNTLIANANLSYEILEGLQIKSNLGYTFTQMKEMQTNPISAQNPRFNNRTGSSSFANAQIRSWIIEPQVEYKKSIAQGKLTVLLGTTFQQNIQEGISISASGYINDAFIEDVNSAPNKSVTSSNYTLYRYNSFFARVNYSWKEKYILNLTGRRDGSSRFGPERRFANFGALGAAWIFSAESFIKDNITFLSFGKLRGSYGVTGSDQIPDYGYLDTYSSTSYPYIGLSSLIPTRLSNPDYSWESNNKIEGALELGFLDDKIFFSTSWYRNRCSSQLVAYPLSTVTGFSGIQFNLPATVQNTGWEFEFETKNIETQNFRWTTSFNLSIPRNKLLEYPNLEGSADAVRYVVGESLNVLIAYHALGVDPQTGLYIFEDVDGDGNIESPNDLQVTKTRGQDFYGGFQNTLNYKGFQLDFMFQFVKQVGVNYLAFGFPAPGNFSNQPLAVLNRWQTVGDKSSVQKFTTDPFSSPYFTNIYSSDNGYSDASFVRLKNVSLSWELPSKWVQRASLRNFRLYFQAQNLLTFTNYQGDPENQSVTKLPPLRMLTVGVQFSF